MATFPGGVYDPTNPTSSSPRNNPSLAGEITGLNDEVVAIETVIGTAGNYNFAAASVSGDGWPTADGSGSGNLQAETSDEDVIGYQITDQGSGGIGLLSAGSGLIYISSSSGGGVLITNRGAAALQLTDSGNGIGIQSSSASVSAIEIFATGSQGNVQIYSEHGQVLITGLPSANPHVNGALYTTAGALMVSSG